MNEPITVLVADDQALLRSTFRLLIDSSPGPGHGGRGRHRAGGRRAGPARAPGRGPDGHPDAQLDGIEDTRVICGAAETAHARVLTLTTFDLDEYVYAALRAGASGFLLNDTRPARSGGRRRGWRA